MLKPYKGICKQCEDDKWIQNKKGICPDCVFRNNHGGKSKAEVYTERQRSKQKVRKTTGERALNLEIWCERPHICHNCKINLGNIPKPFMFMHLRSKGACPELRLVKSNIEIACLKCHHAYDFQGTDAYNARRDLHLGVLY